MDKLVEKTEAKKWGDEPGSYVARRGRFELNSGSWAMEGAFDVVV